MQLLFRPAGELDAVAPPPDVDVPDYVRRNAERAVARWQSLFGPADRSLFLD